MDCHFKSELSILAVISSVKFNVKSYQPRKSRRLFCEVDQQLLESRGFAYMYFELLIIFNFEAHISIELFAQRL